MARSISSPPRRLQNRRRDVQTTLVEDQEESANDSAQEIQELPQPKRSSNTVRPPRQRGEVFLDDDEEPVEFFLQPDLPEDLLRSLELAVTTRGGHRVASLPLPPRGVILIDPRTGLGKKFKRGETDRWKVVSYTFVRACILRGYLLPVEDFHQAKPIFEVLPGRALWVHVSSDLGKEVVNDIKFEISKYGGHAGVALSRAHVLIGGEPGSATLEDLRRKYAVSTMHVESTEWVKDCIRRGYFQYTDVPIPGAENVGGRVAGVGRAEYPASDDMHLVRFLAKYPPTQLDPHERARFDTYRYLTKNMYTYKWFQHHTESSWQTRYTSNRLHFDKLIAQYLEEHPEVVQRSPPIRKTKAKAKDRRAKPPAKRRHIEDSDDGIEELEEDEAEEQSPSESEQEQEPSRKRKRTRRSDDDMDSPVKKKVAKGRKKNVARPAKKVTRNGQKGHVYVVFNDSDEEAEALQEGPSKAPRETRSPSPINVEMEDIPEGNNVPEAGEDTLEEQQILEQLDEPQQPDSFPPIRQVQRNEDEDEGDPYAAAVGRKKKALKAKDPYDRLVRRDERVGSNDPQDRLVERDERVSSHDLNEDVTEGHHGGDDDATEPQATASQPLRERNGPRSRQDSAVPPEPSQAEVPARASGRKVRTRTTVHPKSKSTKAAGVPILKPTITLGERISEGEEDAHEGTGEEGQGPRKQKGPVLPSMRRITQNSAISRGSGSGQTDSTTLVASSTRTSPRRSGATAVSGNQIDEPEVAEKDVEEPPVVKMPRPKPRRKEKPSLMAAKSVATGDAVRAAPPRRMTRAASASLRR